MVVKVEHLWKTFQIPHERRTTLFENLVGLMRPNQYETFTILKDISFKVDRGECIGIIGDNGSGKSTLLKIIANILRPTKGKVKVKGKITPFLELGVGFQPDLTVKENIGVYATIMGLSKKEIRERTDGVIDFAGLRKFEDTKLKNLSSGMQVRLAFSTAIQTDPDVLLVDEVLAVGDLEFQQKCFDVFNRYKKEGVTILFVSHDMGAVRRFCDKVILMKQGEMVTQGDPGRIIDTYVYKKGEESAARQGAKTRWGNHKAEITDVQFLDKDFKSNQNFMSGDPMTIRIFYEAREPISSPIFGIIFYSQDTYCYGTTTEFKGCETGLMYGNGYVDFAIERLPFIAGKFDVTLAINSSDYKEEYDWHDRLYSFHVYNSSRDLGMFSVDFRWSIVKSSQHS